MIESISNAAVEILHNSGFTTGQVMGLVFIVAGFISVVMITKCKYKARSKD